MFKALMRVQLASVIASLMRSSKGNEKRSAASVALIALLFVFVIGVLAFAVGITFYVLAVPLNGAGLAWFYFAMAALTAFALCFIGSVFTAQQQLFSARDNELLLAMPVPPAQHTRLAHGDAAAHHYALELIVLLPAYIVWGVQIGFSAAGVIAAAAGALLLPLLVMCFTCLFAWILAAISARMRNKTVVTLVLSLLFLAAYFYVYMNLNDLLTAIVENSAAIAGAMSAVYPAYAFGQAIAEGDLIQLAGFAACCVVPFAIVYAILSRGFLAVTTRRPSAKKLVYRERALRVGSVRGALLRRELARFGANGMYILNAAMGSILTVAAAVALVIYRGTLIALLEPLPAGWTAALMAVALCFLCATDVISAPSISLEGKTLWLLKSLPVEARAILMSKVELHLVIALPPTLIASACCVIALPPHGGRGRGGRAAARADVRFRRAAGRGGQSALPQIRLHQRDCRRQEQRLRGDSHVRLLGRAGRAGDTLFRLAGRPCRPHRLSLHLRRRPRRRLRGHVCLSGPRRLAEV